MSIFNRTPTPHQPKQFELSGPGNRINDPAPRSFVRKLLDDPTLGLAKDHSFTPEPAFNREPLPPESEQY